MVIYIYSGVTRDRNKQGRNKKEARNKTGKK
jgi:hypothetical protein